MRKSTLFSLYFLRAVRVKMFLRACKYLYLPLPLLTKEGERRAACDAWRDQTWNGHSYMCSTIPFDRLPSATLRNRPFDYASFDYASFDYAQDRPFGYASFDYASFDYASFDYASFDYAQDRPFDYASFDYASFDYAQDRSFCFGKRTQNHGRPGVALRVPLPQSRR